MAVSSQEIRIIIYIPFRRPSNLTCILKILAKWNRTKTKTLGSNLYIMMTDVWKLKIHIGHAWRVYCTYPDREKNNCYYFVSIRQTTNIMIFSLISTYLNIYKMEKGELRLRVWIVINIFKNICYNYFFFHFLLLYYFLTFHT